MIDPCDLCGTTTALLYIGVEGKAKGGPRYRLCRPCWQNGIDSTRIHSVLGKKTRKRKDGG